MLKTFEIKRLGLTFIFCSIIIALAMVSVSASDVTVSNSTDIDTIQGYISDNGANDLSVGNTLTLNAGNYTFNKGLVIDKSINIVGNGNVWINAGSSVDKNTNSIVNYGIHITAPNVNITGISFSGFYYGISANGTSISGATNLKITNCAVIENRRGMNLASVDGVIINKSKMNYNEREGINFDGNNIFINNSELNNNLFEGVHGHASNSMIANSTINHNGFGAAGTSTMPGLDLHGHGVGVENFILEGNTVNYNAGAGLALNIQKAKVINNTFAYNNGNGISIKASNYNATNNLIENNIISNNNGNGIEINSAGNNQTGEFFASNNTISKNIIFNNKNGIVINKISPNRQGMDGFNGSIVENNTVSGNRIFDNTENGVITTGDKTTIQNNIIFANAQVGVVNSGLNTQISGNVVDGINGSAITVPPRENTTITMGDIKGTYNKVVILSATLKSGKIMANGKLVYFYVNGKLVGEGRTNNQGIATFNYKVTSTGTLKVNAVFHGDDQYTSSSKLNSNLVVQQLSELKIKNVASVKKRNVKLTTTIANIGYNKGKVKITFKLAKGLTYKKPKVSTGTISYNKKTRTLTWTVNSLKLHKTNSAKIAWNLKANKKGKYNLTPKIAKTNSINVLSNNNVNVRVS